MRQNTMEYNFSVATPIQETTETTTTESTTRRTRPYNTRPRPTIDPTITQRPEMTTRTTHGIIHTRIPTTTDSTIYAGAPTHRTTNSYKTKTHPTRWTRSTDPFTGGSKISTITTRMPSTFYPKHNSRNTTATSGTPKTRWYTNNATDWTDRTYHRNRTTTLISNNRFPYSTTTELSTSRDRNEPETTGIVYSIPSYPSSGTQSSIPPPEPEICQGKFDSVANLRGEIFIFKDEYIWRLQDRGRIISGYPVLLRQMFPYLPENIKKIDAAYQRPDGNMILFTGDLYWVFDGSNFVEHSPRYIRDYGIPLEIGGIDAVQTWSRNGKTYIYKGDRFWRYDETNKIIDLGYPAHIHRWRGIPESLDAAMTWKDGSTYFFKDDQYWTLDNNDVEATYDSPRSSTREWLGCS